MFEEGRRQVLFGTAWRNCPPGTFDSEILPQRAGTKLVRTAPPAQTHRPE